MQAPARKKILVIALLAGITFAAYGRVRELPFITYDDPEYITGNLRVQAGLTAGNLVWAATAIVGANWHPVTLISHMTDCQLFHLNAAGHHITSLALHLLNVLLLFWVLQLATGFIWRSGFVAALFAVHPLNVESVAWIAERKNVLSMFFFLLAVWAYLWYSRAPNIKRYAAVSACFILALMTKPMIVTFPFVLLLIDYWPLAKGRMPAPAVSPVANGDRELGLATRSDDDREKQRRTSRHLILEKIPLVVIAAAGGLITLYAQKAGGGFVALRHPFGSRVRNAIVSYVIYLCKSVWPTKLAVFYPFPQTTIPLWEVGLAAAALLAATAIALIFARRFKFVACGWLWYLVTLAPMIGFIQVGYQARADRYMYLPLIGIFIIAVWLAGEVIESLKGSRVPVLVAAVCLLVLLTAATVHQLSYWTDSISLFQHAEQVTTGNYVAYSNLSYAYTQAGRLKDAEEEIAKTAPSDPSYAQSQEILGMLSLQAGDVQGAIDHLKAAIQASPNEFDANNKLGIVLARSGHLTEAVPYFRRALDVKPDNVLAMANLAGVDEQIGEENEAISLYSKAISLIGAQPLFDQNDSAKAMTENIHLQMAELFLKGGALDQAEGHFNQVLRLDPGSSAAREGLNRLASLRALRN